jgi:tetratricopeptide (TPR) repeat protein
MGASNRPSDAEIAAALARVTSSTRFRDSPQIVAFLRYVVDRTLAGKDDQIKGYTIAVEALGRDASFDPNTQSIVRTEAARLRQELARYYADGGRHDPVRIELPRGRYVPAFLRQEPLPDQPSAPEPLSGDGPEHSAVASSAGRRLPVRLSAVGLVLLGVVGYGLLDVLVIDAWNMQRLTAATGERPVGAIDRRRDDEPRIAIAPVGTIGRPQAGAIDAARVHAELTNALSRFEDITVVAAVPDPLEAGPGGSGTAGLDYVLVPTLVGAANGQTLLNVRLIAMPDRAVVWQDDFATDQAGSADDATPQHLVLHIASVLLQPFGIIPAAERRKLGTPASAARECVLGAADLARYFDPELHERTRTCLEKAIADDPGFAQGHVLLARLHYRDYIFGHASAEILEKALRLVRRAIELAPTSARAHYTAMNILVARGFVERGLAHGDKALALNPYDVRVLMQVGGQLVAAGRIDRGLALLKQARASMDSNPLPLTWSLFLGAYLEDDVATMTTAVDQMPGDYDFNSLARALLAARKGDMAAARATLSVLQARRSIWIENPREMFSRFIPARDIVERLAGGLDRITGPDSATATPAVR